MNRILKSGSYAVLFGLLLSAQLTQLAHARVALDAYQAAAEALAEDISSRSGDLFLEMLDFDSIVDVAFEGVDFPSRQENSLRKGMLMGKSQLVNKIVSQLSDYGYVKVLRVKDTREHVKALMRLDYGDLGYGYMDLHLVKKGDKVRIVDWYDYTTGQTYTRSLNQIIAMMAPTPTVVGRIFDIASDRDDDIKNIQKFIGFLSKNQYESARDAYNSLSKEVANSRMVLVMMVFAASASQVDEHYFDALARLDKYHGKDTSLTFILLDYYYLNENYDKVVAVVDSLLNEFAVDDAALIAIKANALNDKGDYKSAIKMARQAAQLEPNLEGAYWALLNANIGAEKYGDAVLAADALERKFDYQLNEETLGASELFNGFLASKDFKAWSAGKTD